MLYPCWVAKAYVRFFTWKQPITKAKVIRAANNSCLKRVHSNIKEHVKNGSTYCFEHLVYGMSVKFVVPRIQKLGYDVCVFNCEGKFVRFEDVVENKDYSIRVMWE